MDEKARENAELDRLNVNATEDQILERLTNLDPVSEDFGKAVEHLKVLQEIEASKARIIIEEDDAKSRRRQGIGSMFVGAVTTLAMAVGIPALKTFVDNRQLMVPREVDDTEKDNRKLALNWSFDKLKGKH